MEKEMAVQEHKERIYSTQTDMNKNIVIMSRLYKT